MLDWLDPQLSQTDYQGLIRDLRAVVAELRGLASGPRARQGLPRPHRAAPRGGLTSASRASHAAAPQLGSVDVARLRLLEAWLEAPGTGSAYDAFLRTITAQGATDTELLRQLRSLLLKNGTPILGWHPQDGCWTFGLSAGEVPHATVGFANARDYAEQALRKLRAADPGIAMLTRAYFRTDLAATNRQAAELVLERTLAGLKESAVPVVLCRPVSHSSATQRDDLAFVDPRLPIHSGACIFLGDKFFSPLSTATLRSLRTRVRDEAHRRRIAATIGGSIVLHEATHLFADTEDVVVRGNADAGYGIDNCLALPASLAVLNADTYAWFTFEVFLDSCALGLAPALPPPPAPPGRP
ncbi:MAG: hypothetical protein IPM29_00505 [Planctomycetes bacterium]|nr:hypothetical protein [Planctomycetota bacterium]